MLLGVVLAFFVEPSRFAWSTVPLLLLAFLATCITASSNYVINETLDAAFDRKHPTKEQRPAANWEIRRRWALAEWLVLGALGVALAWGVNPAFASAMMSCMVAKNAGPRSSRMTSPRRSPDSLTLSRRREASSVISGIGWICGALKDGSNRLDCIGV